MKRNINEMRLNVSKKSEKGSVKNKKYFKISLGIFAAGLLTSAVFGVSCYVSGKDIKRELEQEVFQTQEYKNYYQMTLDELEQAKNNKIIDGGEYYNKKRELNDVMKYLSKLSDAERAQFQAEIDRYSNVTTVGGLGSMFAILISSAIGVGYFHHHAKKELDDFFEETQKKKMYSRRNDGVHMRDGGSEDRFLN